MARRRAGLSPRHADSAAHSRTGAPMYRLADHVASSGPPRFAHRLARQRSGRKPCPRTLGQTSSSKRSGCSDQAPAAARLKPAPRALSLSEVTVTSKDAAPISTPSAPAAANTSSEVQRRRAVKMTRATANTTELNPAGLPAATEPDSSSAKIRPRRRRAWRFSASARPSEAHASKGIQPRAIKMLPLTTMEVK